MLLTESLQQSTVATDLFFSSFSEGGILFRPGTRKIWTLNHVAAVIWCLACDKHNAEDISAKIALAYGISKEQALSDTETVLRALGVDNFLEPETSGIDVREIESDVPPLAVRDYSPVIAPNEVERYFFNSLGHLIEFCSIDHAASVEYVRALQAFSVSTIDRTSDTTILVLASDTAGSKLLFDVYVNDQCSAKGVAREDIVPTLIGLTFTSIAESLTDKLLFHAAVLEKNNRVFLFPGDAGSGKTTLVASLSCKGYNFFADELALLDPCTGHISPLPLPMSIKAGAIPVLRHWYPELDSLPLYTRADGKKVKILSPLVNSEFDINSQVAPAAIIFPRYDSSVAAKISPLGKAETISRLVGLCSSSRGLVEQDIVALVRLVDDNPCYEAIYDDICMVYDFLEQIS